MFNKEHFPKEATLLGKKFIYNAETGFKYFVRWTIIQFKSLGFLEWSISR